MERPSIGAIGSAAPEPRQHTEMEQLSQRLGNMLADLRETNDRMASALARFRNEPAAAVPNETKPNIGPAEPLPGTLASLAHLTEVLANEVERAGNFRSKLADIF